MKTLKFVFIFDRFLRCWFRLLELLFKVVKGLFDLVGLIDSQFVKAVDLPQISKQTSVFFFLLLLFNLWLNGSIGFPYSKNSVWKYEVFGLLLFLVFIEVLHSFLDYIFLIMHYSFSLFSCSLVFVFSDFKNSKLGWWKISLISPF